MAEFYLDVSAVGNQYQAYADTPTTWGVPQDGNGKALTGGAVSIATLDCAGASATGTGTVGVLGVTVSSTLNASGAALATAIVTAINASATAVSATYSAALQPLNRLVFARVNPGVSTEVQIMLRIAGTDWNGMTPTRANITGGGVTAFAGGVDGPFAYFCNNGTVFGRAQATYGLVVQKPGSVTEPGANPVIVRTRRSGVNLSVLMQHTASLTIGHQTGLSERHFVFDNGTYWSGDDGQFLFETTQTSGGSVSTQFGPGVNVASAIQTFNAMKVGGFRIRHSLLSGTGAYGAIVAWGQGRSRWKGVFAEAGNAKTQLFVQVISTLASNNLEAIDCKFSFLRNQQASGLGESTPFYQRIQNSTFEWSGIGANIAALFGQSGYAANASAATSKIHHTNCSYVVDAGAYSVVGIYATPLPANSRSVTTLDGCSGIQNPSIGLSAVGPTTGGPELYWTDPTKFSFRYENCSMTTDWVQGSPYPTLYAQTPDGVPMSIRASWEAARLGAYNSFEVTRISSFYRDTAAQREVRVEMCVPAAEVPNTTQVYMTVSYTDTSGTKRFEHSRGDLLAMQLPSAAVALPNGVGLGAWSLNGIGGQSSRRLVVNTQYAIKQSSEVVCTLMIGGAPVGTHSLYIDPTVVFV